MELPNKQDDVLEQLSIINERLVIVERRVRWLVRTIAIFAVILLFIILMSYANSRHIEPPPPANPDGSQTWERIE